MTNAGWYPDPAGAPDTYRYWDGQSWSQMTTTHPPAPQQPQQPQQQQPNAGGYGAVPPPPTASPTPTSAPGYGQPWSPQPPNGGGSGGGSGKTIGIIIAAVLVLVLLGVGGFFGVRALSGDDGDKSADDDSSQSDEPTDGSDPTDGSSDPSSSTGSSVTPTGIQCTGGDPTPEDDPGSRPKTLSGGGLTIPRLSGYTVDIGFSDAFSFADDVVIQYANVTANWVSEYAVGGLPKASGFTSTDQAAEIIMQCLTMNDRVYKGFDSRTDLKSEAVTVDGKSGHSITSEIRVKDAEVTVEGDVTTVIVVDTGDPDTYGLYIGVAPIGDPDRIAQAERVVGRIKVD